MSAYEATRSELREAELALMLQREKVAELRRRLPPGPSVEDYVFETANGPVRLSQLFTRPDRPLVLYHFMLGKAQSEACPMCSMWTDGWAGVARHVAQTIDFALVTAAPVEWMMDVVTSRGWSDLRWLSAANNSFKLDIGGEDQAGNQSPFISAYELAEGKPRMTYSGGAYIAGEHWRGLDLLSPVWHLLDLTRSGRGDWSPKLEYPA
jgi:predicted dithiol-disulfide oxidoreductase (DUF899 family)